MSAALQTEETARERLLDSVLDQLEPMYAMLYDGDIELARQAAFDAMEPYLQDDSTDLAVAGQIIACGLTTMRVLNLCMKPDIKSEELARLVRTVDTLGRTEQRHRKTGLYPIPPKPAPTQRAAQADLHVVSAAEPLATAPDSATDAATEDTPLPGPRKAAALTPPPTAQDSAAPTQKAQQVITEVTSGPPPRQEAATSEAASRDNRTTHQGAQERLLTPPGT